MKKRNFSWAIALLLFNACLIYLLLSGQIRNFLHPKMDKFMYLSIFLITNLCLLEIFFLIKKKTSLSRENGGWIFIFPVLLLIFFNPKSIDLNTLAKKNISVDLGGPYKQLEFKNKPYEFKEPKSPFEGLASDKEKKAPSISKEDSQKRAQKDVDKALDRFKNGFKKDSNHTPQVIEINPKEIEFAKIDGQKFKDLLAKAYTSKAGTKLEIHGFAFYQDDFKDGQVSISRLLMTCCVADSSIIGLLADVTDFKDQVLQGQWYSFSGTIAHELVKDPASGKDSRLPVLKVDKVKEIETPISPYVYP